MSSDNNILILESGNKTNILVVGDVMLDRYFWGIVNRISPEAPVPIVNLEKISTALGGAANVAANVAGLGANPFLTGITGADAEADILIAEAQSKNINTDFLLKSSRRQTTIKTRIIAHSQQIVRIDQENKLTLNAAEEKQLLGTIKKLFPKIKIIVVSDYGKGIVSEKFVSELIAAAGKKKKIVLIDPKGKNYAKYRGAALLTPNRYELAEACQLDNFEQATLEKAGKKLLSELSLESLLVTQGEDGMTLIERNTPVLHLPVTARKVYDVTGAGDTVIGSLAFALSLGKNLPDAARFANRCAGLVVEQMGTSAINLQMLEDLKGEKSE